MSLSVILVNYCCTVTVSEMVDKGDHVEAARGEHRAWP